MCNCKAARTHKQESTRLVVDEQQILRSQCIWSHATWPQCSFTDLGLEIRGCPRSPDSAPQLRWSESHAPGLAGRSSVQHCTCQRCILLQSCLAHLSRLMALSVASDVCARLSQQAPCQSLTPMTVRPLLPQSRHCCFSLYALLFFHQLQNYPSPSIYVVFFSILYFSWA